MGHARWKVVFEHAQNARIQIHRTHTRNLIRAFALHRCILKCPIILLADSEGSEQTVWMPRLIWPFALRICPKTRFRMAHDITER